MERFRKLGERIAPAVRQGVTPGALATMNSMVIAVTTTKRGSRSGQAGSSGCRRSRRSSRPAAGRRAGARRRWAEIYHLAERAAGRLLLPADGLSGHRRRP